MALDFPPCERNDPILSRNRMNRREGTSEIEVEPEEELEGFMGRERNE